MHKPTNPNDKHNSTISLPPTALEAGITNVATPFAESAANLLVAFKKVFNIIPKALAKQDAKDNAELDDVKNAIENEAKEKNEIAKEVNNEKTIIAEELLKNHTFDRKIEEGVITTIKNAIEGQTTPKTGGGRSSIKHIQRGGQQSLKRTTKSINEFLNSSVTASHIINMVKKGGRTKRRLNRHAKKYKTRRQI